MDISGPVRGSNADEDVPSVGVTSPEPPTPVPVSLKRVTFSEALSHIFRNDEYEIEEEDDDEEKCADAELNMPHVANSDGEMDALNRRMMDCIKFDELTPYMDTDDDLYPEDLYGPADSHATFQDNARQCENPRRMTGVCTGDDAFIARAQDDDVDMAIQRSLMEMYGHLNNVPAIVASAAAEEEDGSQVTRANATTRPVYTSSKKGKERWTRDDDDAEEVAAADSVPASTHRGASAAVSSSTATQPPRHNVGQPPSETGAQSVPTTFADMVKEITPELPQMPWSIEDVEDYPIGCVPNWKEFHKYHESTLPYYQSTLSPLSFERYKQWPAYCYYTDVATGRDVIRIIRLISSDWSVYAKYWSTPSSHTEHDALKKMYMERSLELGKLSRSMLEAETTSAAMVLSCAVQLGQHEDIWGNDPASFLPRAGIDPDSDETIYSAVPVTSLKRIDRWEHHHLQLICQYPEPSIFCHPYGQLLLFAEEDMMHQYYRSRDPHPMQ